MNYDVDYFIEKFEAIPEDKWGTHNFNVKGACCAMGHCGVVSTPYDTLKDIEYTPETNALFEVLRPVANSTSLFWAIANINDNGHPDYPQPTPKQRILAALYDIKAMQQPKERIRYVAVDAEVKEIINTQIFN